VINAYDLATASVTEELQRQAKAAADKAVKESLKPMQRLVEGAGQGDAIRVTTAIALIDVWARYSERWYNASNNYTDEGMVKHLVGVIAEGGIVERLVAAK